MDLEAHAHDMFEHIRDLVQIAEQQSSAKDLGRLSVDLAGLYRSLGICALLTQSDTEMFFHALIQSGVTRRHYLRRCHTEDISQHTRFFRASIEEGFMDAIAADQIDLAKEIGQLSPSTWLRSAEYEDDFLYCRFLHEFVQLNTDDSELSKILVALESVLAAKDNARLEVCKALLGSDSEAFQTSLEALIDEREERMAELADPKQDSVLALEYSFAPNRLVFIEGLALLRLARLRGIDVETTEYELCPSLVRKPGYPPFSPFSWPLDSL